MNQHGGSLIEIVGVMAIVTVMATICGPSWAGLAARQQGWSTAREIAGELRLARQMAMSGHMRVRAGIDVQGMTLRITIADDSMHPLRVYEWGSKSITIESMSNGSQISFYPSGRSATANTIVLRDRQYNKRVITISITGKVTLS